MDTLSPYFPIPTYCCHWWTLLFGLKMLLLELIKCHGLHWLAWKEKLYLQNWGMEHNSIFFRTVIILSLICISISFVYILCHAPVFVIYVWKLQAQLYRDFSFLLSKMSEPENKKKKRHVYASSIHSLKRCMYLFYLMLDLNE